MGTPQQVTAQLDRAANDSCHGIPPSDETSKIGKTFKLFPTIFYQGLT
jgi:hypothetical protein